VLFALFLATVTVTVDARSAAARDRAFRRFGFRTWWARTSTTHTGDFTERA
jgi:hypothetical protein